MEAPAQHSNGSLFEGETPSIKRYDSAGALYLEEINKHFGKPEDLGSVDSYIEVLDKELDILKLQVIIVLK